MLLVTNVLVAVLAWIAFRWIGLDVDDRADREDEFRSRFRFAAVLGLALGNLGNVAQHSDCRHRQGRLRAFGAAAAGGWVAGRIGGRRDPATAAGG